MEQPIRNTVLDAGPLHHLYTRSGAVRRRRFNLTVMPGGSGGDVGESGLRNPRCPRHEAHGKKGAINAFEKFMGRESQRFRTKNGRSEARRSPWSIRNRASLNPRCVRAGSSRSAVINQG